MRGAALTFVALAAIAIGGFASAQEAAGRIEGTIASGTAGASIPNGLEVTLLSIDGATVSPVAQTILEGGRYAFEVPADGRLTFLPLVTYQGIRYLGEVAILTPEEQTAVRDLVLFQTTNERPQLSISVSSATVLAIDRGLGQLVIVREDLVENPSDRIYVGGDDGVTVTLPVLDGTIEANGQDAGEGEYRHDGGVMQAAIPLRPGATALRTQYLVAYDLGEDDYRMRLTAPFETAAMELRVPPRFIRDLRALEGSSRGEDVVLSGELEGERLLVVERDEPARAGEALLAELEGLSGNEAVLPLTERSGAVIASIVALLVLGGAAAIAIRRDRTPLDAPEAASTPNEDGTP
jgi:hypothetical protein